MGLDNSVFNSMKRFIIKFSELKIPKITIVIIVKVIDFKGFFRQHFRKRLK